MDEAELSALFREAARDAPEATFDEHDVVRGSRRVTARRRTALAGGSAVAAALLVGGLGFGTGAFWPTGSPVGQGPLSQPHQPPAGQSPISLPQPQQPATPDMPRSGGPIVLSEQAGGHECGPPDRELAAALAEQLPEVAGTSPIGAPGPCPADARTAAVSARQGPSSGKVAVLLTPAGAQQVPQPKGAVAVHAPTRSGKTVTVLSTPTGPAPPPFADRLNTIAQGLAPRF